MRLVSTASGALATWLLGASALLGQSESTTAAARPEDVAVVAIAETGFRQALQPDQATAEPTVDPAETPIVEPEPEPEPVYLPVAERGLDYTKPPPISPLVRGYVAALAASGRRACSPATHVVLELPEGSAGNTARAVVYASPDHPEINLDLYVTDFVEAAGLEDVPPPECRPITRRLIQVDSIRAIPVPPGALAPAPAYRSASPGKRITTAIE